MERRAFFELRAEGRKLTGYAAKFNTEAKIANFIEVIAPGAFIASLRAGQDILALLDHNREKVLARTRSKTLRLSEDSIGLAFELDVPDTTAGRDALALAERGDLGGMSFAFLPNGESWNGNRRTLTAIDLKEISVVSAFPAYEGTTVVPRSKTPLLNSARLYLESCRPWD